MYKIDIELGEGQVYQFTREHLKAYIRTSAELACQKLLLAMECDGVIGINQFDVEVTISDSNKTG